MNCARFAWATALSFMTLLVVVFSPLSAAVAADAPGAVTESAPPVAPTSTTAPMEPPLPAPTKLTGSAEEVRNTTQPQGQSEAKTEAKGESKTKSKSEAKLSKEDCDVPKYFRIPVFYVTDRNRITKKGPAKDEIHFGNERKYRGLCTHELFLGVAYCNIKNTEKKTLDEITKKLGWQLPRKGGEGPDGTALWTSPTYKELSAKFFDEVYAKAVETPDRELFMFIPGYMSTFESGLRSAARFVYYSERPMILYSWASKGKLTQYFADEATIEWSQDHFNDILNKMSLLAYRTPSVHSRVYSHSMGGRLVLRATPYLKNSKALREISVVCPDVDDGVVKHYAASYFDGKTNMLVRLYVSKRDFMLRFSQFVHGGYNRMGEETQPLDTLLPKNAKKVVPDAVATAEHFPCPESLHRRLLTIDFSDVDVGTLGHRIPVEVLSGLSQNGHPGRTLKLSLVTPKGKVIQENESSTEEEKDGIVKISKPGWRGTPVLGTIYRYRPRLQLWRTKDWSLP